MLRRSGCGANEDHQVGAGPRLTIRVETHDPPAWGSAGATTARPAREPAQYAVPNARSVATRITAKLPRPAADCSVSVPVIGRSR
jgi:hypothetical protein